MNTLWQYTSWMEFKKWSEKFGWIQLYFRLHTDKTAQAKFLLPSGKIALVEIADDVEGTMSVMEVRING